MLPEGSAESFASDGVLYAIGDTIYMPKRETGEKSSQKNLQGDVGCCSLSNKHTHYLLVKGWGKKSMTGQLQRKLSFEDMLSGKTVLRL